MGRAGLPECDDLPLDASYVMTLAVVTFLDIYLKRKMKYVALWYTFN